VATLADAFVRVRPDLNGFSGKLKADAERDIDPAGKSVGSKFGSGIMAGVGGVMAAAAVVKFFRGAFDEATEAAKVTRLTEAALKSTGGQAHVTADQISQLANRLSVMAGVDDEVIQSSENVLLTFTGIRNELGSGNDIFDQAEEAALNLSAALGTDLQGSVVLVGKALNDPIKGLTALSRVGVSFTEQQREQIKAMTDAGNTMGAQKLILAELTTEFGGAAAAAASPADKARVAWGNFQEEVGNKLLPTLNSILDFGIKNQAWLTPLVSSIAELGVVVGTVMVVQKAWSALQTVIGIGLEGTAVKARRATLAIAALAIAGQALDSFSGRDTDIQGLGDSLDQFGKTAKVSGELTNLFGEDLSDWSRQVEDATGAAGALGNALEFIPGLKSFDEWANGHSFAQAKANIASVDDQLSQMVRAGNAETASKAFLMLMQSAKLTADEMEALMPKYTNAIMAVGKSTDIVTQSTKNAADAGKKLLDSWNALNGTMLTADEAMLAARHAIDGVTDAFSSGGRSIKGNSEAALENRVALEQAARAASEAAAAYLANGGTAAGAAKIMRDFRAAAEKATGATGAGAKAVHSLAGELFSLPKTTNVQVNVHTNWIGQAASSIANSIRDILKAAHGHSEGGFEFFAGGGMEDHVAQITRAGTLRIWGEPETGGEAYIPLAPSKRGRSVAILADVAQRFGYSLTRAGGDDQAAGPQRTGGGDGGRVAQLLEVLIAAVERIAPGVGAEINGSVATMRVLGRTR
jgi:hypothetical protein